MEATMLFLDAGCLLAMIQAWPDPWQREQEYKHLSRKFTSPTFFSKKP